jgi:SAM-dependent methyltransferase
MVVLQTPGPEPTPAELGDPPCWRGGDPGADQRYASWVRGELERTGARPRDAGRLLELECGPGRLLAELIDLAAVCELWGCDPSAAAIRWAEQHHSPRARFFTLAGPPHLPFEDRSFGIILAPGLLIHQDALADSWLLELRRCLRQAGRLVVGFLDEGSLAALGEQPEHPLARQLGRAGVTLPVAEAFGRLIVPGRSRPVVIYDRSYLIRHLAAWFRVLSVTGEGDGLATVLVLDRL